MESSRPRVFVFCWPSHIGGADTKLVLLHRDIWFTVIPNDEEGLKEREWVKYLERLGIHSTLLERLPRDLTGCAFSLSNTRFFADRIAHRAKERGLKIVWSSEMMWHHTNELDAVREGVIDYVLYASEFQRSILQPNYGDLPGRVTGNYIDADDFPFLERRNPTFTIGRLSRHDPLKYPENFPVFYESLGLEDTAFRVMAWSHDLAREYRWHEFDERWDLLAPAEEPTTRFLQSLDLFVYPLGHRFQESWGRSTVEAMLTGAIPLVPRGHHFEQLVVNGESGFFGCD